MGRRRRGSRPRPRQPSGRGHLGLLVSGALATALVALAALHLPPLPAPAARAAGVAVAGAGATAVSHLETAIVTSAAVPKGAVTVSPAPDSRTADPATQISFLGRPAGELGTITVVGSKTGPHSGTLEAYSTGDGASFVPDHPFVAGETVTVHTDLPIAGTRDGTFHFVVADVLPLVAYPHPPPLRTDVAGVQHFASAPSLEPPAVTVDANRHALPGGDVLLTPKGTTGEAGPMIVRQDGSLVWFDPLPDKLEAFDLNEQELHGKPVLTWFQGEVLVGHGQGVAVIANDRYQTIAVVHGGNGTMIDLHDLELTNRGTVFVTAYRTMRWNLTGVGGPKDGTVFDGVVQEIDVKTGLVEEEWDSLDHVPVTASDVAAPSTPSGLFDYFHVNGVQPLPGGDLLISSRNTSAAYLVDPADNGKIMWRLGGKSSSFAMGPGTVFWYQHDVRLRAGNVLTIFDNGASPPREPESRALFVRLDMADHTASLVRQDTSPLHHVLASALGNVEPLAHGSVFVGWGTAPNFSAFTRSGHLLYDATLPGGDDTYRAYLRPWSAAPLTPPSLAVTGTGAATAVSVSWNGATDVARWEVLTGTDAAHLHEVASAPASGFQTTLHPGALGARVEVEALASNGSVLGHSAPVSP